MLIVNILILFLVILWVKNMRLYSYILSASKNPDKIKCQVPYKLNDKKETIFFGACKRNLRKLLAKECNLIEKKIAIPKTDIYLLGFNGSNTVRKIVWMGKIEKLFTFEEAYNIFYNNSEFPELKSDTESPLHLKPISENNRFGYELISEFHKKNDQWVTDIVNSVEDVDIEGKKFFLKKGYSREKLVKDCCFICENIFFADGQGKGIEINDEISDYLSKMLELNYPIKAKTFSEYNIFGKTNDKKAFGFPGKWLETNNEEIIKNLVRLVLKQKKEVKT